MYDNIIEKHYNRWVEERKKVDSDVFIVSWGELDEKEKDLFRNISTRVANSVYSSIIIDLLKGKILDDGNIYNANLDTMSSVIVHITKKFSTMSTVGNDPIDLCELTRIYGILPHIIDSFRSIEKCRDYYMAADTAKDTIKEIMDILMQ